MNKLWGIEYKDEGCRAGLPHSQLKIKNIDM